MRVLIALMLFGSYRAVGAQPAPESHSALLISARTPLARYHDAHSPIEFGLSRPLSTDDGELVILAGNLDVTALTSRTRTSLVVTPGVVALPAGESQLVVMSRRKGEWVTLATFSIRILGAAGFVRSAVNPTVNISSTGQIADGRSAGTTSPASRPAQDITLAGGIRSQHERTGFTFESQSNLVGASRDELALRFAQRGDKAPLLDLSDYAVSIRAARAKIDIGNISLGASRQLVQSFSSRGFSVTTGPSWAALTLGSVAGAPIVGWDNPLGVAAASHRLSAASFGVELVRARPGAALVRLTMLNGALQPRAGFTQGAVNDAERSTGAGVEFSAKTPGQRAQLAGGYSQSTFDNPATDAQLVGGLNVVPVVRDRRAARYAEASLQVLNNAHVFLKTAASLSVGWRHERIDPLYRSVGVNMQADRNEHAFDLNGALGAIALQGSATRGRNNLANLSSVLTSRTNGFTMNIAAPTSALFHAQRHAAWYPAVGTAVTSAHQFAMAAGTHDEFRPADFANQHTATISVTADWQSSRWRIGLRSNRSRQDNRQPDRERADFTGLVQNVMVGRTLSANLDAAIDVNVERQHNDELVQTNTLRRLGLTTNWRVTRRTTATNNVSLAVSRTPPATSNATNVEFRSELAHGIHLYGRNASARSGQLFLRFSRASVTMLPFGAAENSGALLGMVTQIQWALNAGLSARVW